MIEIRTPAAPVETVTEIRPSELLRLGRMLVPARAVGVLARYRRGEAVAACAMGAMGIAAGAPIDTRRQWYWWPGGVDAAPQVAYPCRCNNGKSFLRSQPESAASVVAHLSDDHGNGRSSRLGDQWPTARIADWLEGLGL